MLMTYYNKIIQKQNLGGRNERYMIIAQDSQEETRRILQKWHFQLYDPYHFYPYITGHHQNRYDLTELYFNVCGTINNTTKELTVYIKPMGALFYDSMVQNNKIKAEFNDVYFICKLKEDSIG